MTSIDVPADDTVSDCCYAAMTMRHNISASGDACILECTQCHERCRATWPPCPLDICDGSGLVAHHHWDTDEHAYIIDGEENCAHLTT